VIRHWTVPSSCCAPSWASSAGDGEVLYEANPGDWKVYTLIILVLTATGVAASVAPALRATHVDPMETLRYE
jgi:hypothetical protein